MFDEECFDSTPCLHTFVEQESGQNRSVFLGDELRDRETDTPAHPHFRAGEVLHRFRHEERTDYDDGGSQHEARIAGIETDEEKHEARNREPAFDNSEDVHGELL